jgi:tetratricopeptide (TPR) repeat protein
LAANGLVVDLRNSRYIDLTEEDFRNPQGWFSWENLPQGVERRIISELGKAVVRPAAAVMAEGFAAALDGFPEVGADVRRACQPDYLLCCLAAECLSSDQPRARLATLTLCRWIDSIKDMRVLLDLPWLCGRCDLAWECAQALKMLIEQGADPGPEGLSNIGAALCDCLGMPQEALQCFLRSIELKPVLQPPRASLPSVAKAIFRDCAASREFGEAAASFHEAIQHGVTTGQGHSFWSSAGVAFESPGLIEEARDAYLAALEHDPDCEDCKASMRRTSGDYGDEQRIELRALQDKLWRAFEYHRLKEALF